MYTLARLIISPYIRSIGSGCREKHLTFLDVRLIWKGNLIDIEMLPTVERTRVNVFVDGTLIEGVYEIIYFTRRSRHSTP